MRSTCSTVDAEAGSGVADAGVGAEHVHGAVRVHCLRDEIGDG